MSMTMGERMLALAQGRAVDRVPFVQYWDMTGPNETAWKLVGREKMGVLKWVSAYRYETPNCHLDQEELERNGLRGIRRRLHTPKGTLESVSYFEPVFNSPSQESHFVKEPSDYQVLLAYFRDLVVHANVDGVRDTLADVGEVGLPHTAVDRTPYQQLWVQWVSMEDLPLHLMLEPDIMAEVIEAMVQVQHRVFQAACEVVKALPVPYIVVPDNITAPVIGKTYFDQYCVPAYNALAEQLDATGKDIPVFVHMDGDLKPLWESIDGCRVRGIDSLSPPPDNDTRVADALARWPEMRVCINFPSSVHLAPPEKVYQATLRFLEEGGRSNRLQIQVSENVPPDIWPSSYPQIVKAIDDFYG